MSALVGTLTTTNGRRVDFAAVFNGLRSTDIGVQAANRIVQILHAYPEAPSANGFAP